MSKSEFHYSEIREEFLLLVSAMHLSLYTEQLYYCKNYKPVFTKKTI